jgi:hypothetical protein
LDDSLCTTNLFKGGAEKQISTRTIHATAPSVEVQQNKIKKGQALLMHISELRLFEAEKKRKTIMHHVPVASLQVKSKERKGEHR